MMTNDVVAITGATRGIGKAVAVSLARRGARMVLVGRSTDANPNRGGLPGTLDSARSELEALGAEVLTVPADLSNADDVQRVIDATLTRFDRCDVLINNAALSFLGSFLDVPPHKWNPVVAINLLAPVALIHGFLPGMIDRGEGRIINVSSGAANTRESGGVQQLPYAATKAALDAMSFGLANQLADTGVAVNILAPSVLTEAVAFHVPDQLDEMAKRMALPEPYGDAVAWLVEQPTTFTGHYLTNRDLTELGALQANDP